MVRAYFQEWVEYLQKVTEDQIEKPHLWPFSRIRADFWHILSPW